MLDAAIVGAGHNGLVAAAYLARAGLSVACFERRDIAGGACVTEELWPGVRASPGAYTLSLLRTEIIRELDLAGHGLRVETHEPYLFAPQPDGRRVVTWSSRARTREALAADWSHGDADGYAHWAGRWDDAAERARPLMLEPASRERWLEAVGPEILEGSIADDLAGIPSEAVRVPFAIQGLIGTLAGPSDPGTAFVGFYHELGEAMDDLEVAAADARAGRPAARPWIEAACQTATDPTLAPEGRHVLSMFCQCFGGDVDAEAAADSAIARFAEVCPGLPDRIAGRIALGPRELEARFGLTGGHIFHGEMLPGQLFESRPGPRRFGGVEGLYLAGSGAHPGGAVTGAPGWLAARAVIEDLGSAAR